MVGRWHLACVKQREEKSVAERLRAAGVGVYLPVMNVRRLYRKAVAELEVAACPGYLFCCTDTDEHFSRAYCTKGVFELLAEPRQSYLVRQMINLQRVIDAGSFTGMDEWREGRPVRIAQGHALHGVTGWLTKRRDTNVVQVGYPLMGNVATVDVDSLYIELLEGEDLRRNDAA